MSLKRASRIFTGLLFAALLASPSAAVQWPLTGDWYGVDFLTAAGQAGTGAVRFQFDQNFTSGCPNGRQYILTINNDGGFTSQPAIRLCNPQDQPGGFTRFTWQSIAIGTANQVRQTCNFDVYGPASGFQGGPAGYRVEWSGCSDGIVQAGAYLAGAAPRTFNQRTDQVPGLECAAGAPGLGIPHCAANASGLQLARCARDCAQRRFLGTGLAGTPPTNCRSHRWAAGTPGVYNPALCVTNVRDADGDRLIDQIEADLAYRHAPLELLTEPQGSENYPSSIEWYLNHVQLYYSHSPNFTSNEHVVASVVRNDASAQGIANQSHPRLLNHSGGTDFSNVAPTGGDFFRLRGCESNVCRRGVLPTDWTAVRNEWKVYANVFPALADPNTSNSTGIMLQYWVFYPYNDTNSAAPLVNTDHEGEWEHIAVKLRADLTLPPSGYNGGQQYTAQGAYFKRHEDPYEWVSAQNMAWEPGTGPFLHPRVWVAEGSHASYASQQSCQAGALLHSDNCYTTVNNTKWYTWPGGTTGTCGYGGFCQGAGVELMSSDATKPTLFSPHHWLGFSGKWGEPTGPAYKSNWTAMRGFNINPILPIW
jgi:hypothetical protein